MSKLNMLYQLQSVFMDNQFCSDYHWKYEFKKYDYKLYITDTRKESVERSHNLSTVSTVRLYKEIIALITRNSEVFGRRRFMLCSKSNTAWWGYFTKVNIFLPYCDENDDYKMVFGCWIGVVLLPEDWQQIPFIFTIKKTIKTLFGSLLWDRDFSDFLD